jgi:hypothetical protein
MQNFRRSSLENWQEVGDGVVVTCNSVAKITLSQTNPGSQAIPNVLRHALIMSIATKDAFQSRLSECAIRRKSHCDSEPDVGTDHIDRIINLVGPTQTRTKTFDIRRNAYVTEFNGCSHKSEHGSRVVLRDN